MEDPCWPMMTGPERVDCEVYDFTRIRNSGTDSEASKKKHPLMHLKWLPHSILFTHFEKIKSYKIYVYGLFTLALFFLCVFMFVNVSFRSHRYISFDGNSKIPRLSDSEKARECFVVSFLSRDVTHVYPTTMISFPGHDFSTHVVPRDRT